MNVKHVFCQIHTNSNYIFHNMSPMINKMHLLTAYAIINGLPPALLGAGADAAAAFAILRLAT
ncbi:protein of unknown function [Moritella yayanosii]|uniref:Uncharacterized protein n=1 Tax=Moritella yayanosii TaxID=69539 RepID=A0A330LL83_9GAMM|nr:protein of unknown function [Moritella yayanosii]